jgi:hypothetical protein
MPRIVSIPSRKIEVEFPDDLPDEEIDAYLQEKYPRSGEDVAFEVEQASQQSLDGAVTVNPFEGENKMSRDDYLLLQEYKASKKSSLGDLLGIATDVAGQVFSDVGKGLTEAGAAAIVGEFSPAVQSAAEGMAAGGVGLYDIGIRILDPKKNIPTKEEFLKRRIPVQGTQTVRGDFGVEEVTVPTFRPATEQDYNDLIDSEMQKDADAVNRLYLMEDIIRGAPIEDIARAGQYVDPTMLAGGASALLKAGAKTLFKKGVARTGAQTAAAVADAVTPPPAGAVQTIESGGTMFAAPTPGVSTAPGRLGQAALGAVEAGAGAVQAVASVPGRLVDAVGNVVERVMPGTSAPLKASAATAAMLGDAGLTAGTIAGLKTTEKTAEVAAAAARAARGEASRAGLLERVAQSPNVSTSARKLAEGLAQIQPALGVAKRVTAQALKEGAAGAAVGAGLGYLAERNLEGAAAGAGAGTAFGGMFGAMRGTFRAGREALGYSTERTARQATGDINSFIAERPEIEQGAWATTMRRLVDVLGPEKAAAQVDAMRIAEANGARLRIATKQEMIENPAPGWAKTTGDELVINPDRILGDTAAHEGTHILFSSTLNRAFKTEIENAIYGAVDPVSGEIVRPGLFTDPDLARVSDLIASLYGETNSGARDTFKGYANQLRKVTDPETLSKARSAVADELTAMYSGQLQGRLRPGRFNPDRLPLVYRRVLNSIEDGILEKLRTTLFEQGNELGFDATRGRFTDSKGRPVRIPELDAIIKRAMQPKRKAVPEAKAKPDLIPVNPADRAVWLRSYGGAQGIVNPDGTPKSLKQIEAEAAARWQDMTSRLSALPENERIGLDFTRDKNGKAVMTAKGQLSDAAINAILSSDTLDQSAKATLREVLMSMKNFDKATFDTRYYGVYTRGRGTNKMVAGVKSASQNEILPYSVEMNSKDGVIIRAVDMTKVRDRLMVALKKPQFKDLYGNAGDALKDFRAYLTNLTNISAIPSETVLGGGVRGAQKRNLFYDALGFRLRNNETLLNVPAEVISKSKNTLKSYRAERFAKLVDSGERFAFEEGTTYERVMRNFQPNAFTKETLPNGEAMTNPDGYRILKQTGGKLFRVYDDKGELIGTASTETAAMKKAQSDAAKTTNNALEKSSMNFAEIDAKPVKGETDVFTTTKNTFLRFQPNENVDLANYIGKTMIALPADRMGIGYAMVGPKGKEQTVPVKSQGGAGYMGLLENAGWAFSDEKAAKSLLGRLRKVARPGEDSVIAAITAMSPINHLKNQTGQLAYVTALQAALDSKQVSLKDLNLYISNLFESVAKSKAKLSAAARSRVQAINSFDDFKRAVTSKSLNFAEMTPILNKMQLKGTKSSLPLSVQKEIGISAFDVARQTADARYADVPFGTVVALVEIPINQTPVQSGFHYSYPWAVSGKSIGFLSEGSPVSQLTSDPRIYNKKGVLQAQPLQTVLPELDLAQQFVENRAKQEPTSTKRFQPVSPEQDAAYMRAAQAGDTATAQKMVDEAINDSLPIDFYHGGNAGARGFIVQFVRGRPDQSYWGGTTKDRALWKTKKTRPLSDNMIEFGAEYFNLSREDAERIMNPPDIVEGAGAWDDPQFVSEFWQRFENDLLRNGDALSVGNGAIAFPGSENIERLSDPITRDSSGNIIPLSQRFNVESPDIRFQPDAASPSILNGSNGTRIIKSPSGKFRVYSVTGTLLGIRDTEQAAKKLATK